MMMKILTLLLLVSSVFTAGAQTPKQDTTSKAKVYDYRIYRYLPAPPKSQQSNPYAFADSAKSKKVVVKTKKKIK
jgi:hypothetical protein